MISKEIVFVRDDSAGSSLLDRGSKLNINAKTFANNNNGAPLGNRFAAVAA